MSVAVVEFKTEYKGGKAVDMVLLAPKGEAFERTKTWHRVKSLVPKDNGDPNDMSYTVQKGRWEMVIGPAYEAWKANQEIPENGTALMTWPALDGSQVEILRKMGLRTIEDVAAMGDADAKALPWPDARKMPEMAAKWLEGQSLADKDRENEELRQRVAAMEEMLAEKAEKPKRGPGRPRKDAEAA